MTLPNGTIRHIRNVVYVPGIKKKIDLCVHHYRSELEG
jgi:hypothetical protein